MVTITRALAGTALAAGLLAIAAPARADVTIFVGKSPTPSSHTVKGGAIGFGLIIVGVEFEGAAHTEDPLTGAPGLKTGNANVLVQTPTSPVQLYATTGVGIYRETLGTASETSLMSNVGGGLKMNLLGPLHLRADYRILHLHGSPKYANVQRFYAGLNLKF